MLEPVKTWPFCYFSNTGSFEHQSPIHFKADLIKKGMVFFVIAVRKPSLTIGLEGQVILSMVSDIKI